MGNNFLHRVISGLKPTNRPDRPNPVSCALLGLALGAATFSSALKAETETESAPPTIQPFNMTYGLTGSGVPFSISADRTLEKEGDGTWKMEIRARNWLGSIRETTRFTWDDCTPQSTVYEYRRRGLGRTREARLELDREAGTAVATRTNSDDRHFEIDEDTTDILSQTLGLQCALMRGERDSITLDVINERRREPMQYQVTAEESIEVPAGRYSALKVERVRDDDSDRQTLLWFVPELGYALARMVQDDGDGRYELVLRSP